jgi:hypothetical protein
MSMELKSNMNFDYEFDTRQENCLTWQKMYRIKLTKFFRTESLIMVALARDYGV